MAREELIELLDGDIQHVAPEMPGEMHHALVLGDKVVSLGRRPDLTVPPIDRRDGTVEVMIAHDLEREEQAFANYPARAQQAEALGNLGLKVHLENLAAEETDHRDMLERLGRDLSGM